MELCIALDKASRKDNVDLVRKLSAIDDLWFKVNYRSFIESGSKIIRDIKCFNDTSKVFVDLKLFDIPSILTSTIREITNLKVEMISIHALCGGGAMRKIAQSLVDVPSGQRPLIVVASSVLTTTKDLEACMMHGSSKHSDDITLINAAIAYENYMNGFCCSIWDSPKVKKYLRESSQKTSTFSGKFITVCSGIRHNLEREEHFRVADIFDAVNSQVDLAVVGRPIYNSRDPEYATKQILDNVYNLVNDPCCVS